MTNLKVSGVPKRGTKVPRVSYSTVFFMIVDFTIYFFLNFNSELVKKKIINKKKFDVRDEIPATSMLQQQLLVTPAAAAQQDNKKTINPSSQLAWCMPLMTPRILSTHSTIGWPRFLAGLCPICFAVPYSFLPYTISVFAFF